jgi:hypothetical protein
MHQRAVVCSLAISALSVFCTAPLAGAAQATTPPSASGQAAAPQSSASSNHIYRVSAFRAAPGRIGDLEKLLTSQAPSPGAAPGDFAVVFRHRQGSDWDFMTIEHIGQQATIDIGTGPPAQPDSPLSRAIAWHGDTFAAGPPLEEFRRALNLQGATAQSGKTGVYVIGDYLAAAGHRGQLRQVLNEIAGETPGRTVTLAHVEGAPWNFLAITRYDSWQQFAQEEEASPAQTGKNPAANRGLALREHLALHHDTLVTIQAVSGSAAAR